MRAAGRLTAAIAASAATAGCTLLVTFADPPPEAIVASGVADAGARADRAPPPTGDDDDATNPNDADGDGVTDAEDCDPADPTIGKELLDDPLTADTARFAPAAGFPQTWSYDNGYVQTSLDALSDHASFLGDTNVGDVTVSVTASSTAVSAELTTRQVFVTLGTRLEGGTFSAVGCGIERSGTQNFTSIVRLNGPPSAIAVSEPERTARESVTLGEDFQIRAELKGGTLRCNVVIRGTTTTVAKNVGALIGGLGLHARETRARFRQARFCRLK